MPRQLTQIRVFVASPSDLAQERQALEDVVRELNLAWSDQLQVVLELVMWETHVSPGISTDAQAVVNEQIRDDFDIFLGLLWSRFGTPTPRAASGTQEEFERALTRHRTDVESVRIMMYFKTAPVSPDCDVDQLRAYL